MRIDGFLFLQFVGFVQHFGRIAVVEGITQLQPQQASQPRIDFGGGGQVVGSFGVVAAVQRAFGKQQVTRKLVGLRQGGNFVQVAGAQGFVVHVVGGMGGNHQRQSAALAGLFVFQHFGRFLLGFLVFAFEISQTGGVQIAAGLAAFTRAAETAQTSGNIKQSAHQLHHDIQQDDE